VAGAATPRAEAAPAAVRSELSRTFQEIRELPPSMREEATREAGPVVAKLLDQLAEAGEASRWGSYSAEAVKRQNTSMGSLKQMGIQKPELVGVLSDKNDAQFLVTVVLSTSLLATVAGVVLPGDWGAFSAYLIGGISIVVVGIGSVAPGLLNFFVDKFARIDPEYRERITRHEAAHFLIGYLMGVPVTGYSIDIAATHTDFIELKLERKLMQGKLATDELDQLAVLSMAGVAAEGLRFEEVMGQEADLYDLQSLMRKSETKLSNMQQQNLTRWAVWYAASMLKQNQRAYDALYEAMGRRDSVADCIAALEAAPVTPADR